MPETFTRPAAGRAFNRILFTVSPVAGAQTRGPPVTRPGDRQHLLDRLIPAVFALEVVARMGAHGRKPGRPFPDARSVFDFRIVAAGFLPLNSPCVVVPRPVHELLP